MYQKCFGWNKLFHSWFCYTTCINISLGCTKHWVLSNFTCVRHLVYYTFHPPQYRTEFIDISFFLTTLDVPLTDRTSDTFVKKNLRRSNLKILPDHRLTVKTDIFRHQAPYHIFHSFIILSPLRIWHLNSFRSSTCSLICFFWLSSHVIYFKLTKVS